MRKWIQSERMLFSPGKTRLKTVVSWSLEKPLRVRRARLNAPDYKERGLWGRKKPVEVGSVLRFEILEWDD